MGQFSWMYADTNNEKALLVSARAYVPCPDGTVIEEECYDGYGRFGGHDIYELVADWNKNYISEKNIRKPLRERWEDTEEGEMWFQAALKRYEIECRRIRDFTSGKSDKYMEETYGKDWKRYIGIDIACYDEENEVLKYPIKICKDKPAKYDLLPSSNADPNQGEYCYDNYDDIYEDIVYHKNNNGWWSEINGLQITSGCKTKQQCIILSEETIKELKL